MRQLRSDKISALLILCIVLFCSSCKQNEDMSDMAGMKKIEISKSSFNGGYVAVWFNPIAGVIEAVKEHPDEAYPKTSDFKFWVEPRDPEFSTLENETADICGIKKIGAGEAVFNKAQKESAASNLTSGIQEDDFAVSNVFYIHAPKGDCVILITKFDQSNSVLSFEWRLLN